MPIATVPARRAGLPGSGAMVWVGPPYSPSDESWGAATLSRLRGGLTPSEPPVPIRLLVPLTVPPPRSLPLLAATIVSVSAAAPRLYTPPPPDTAELPTIVQAARLRLPVR